MVAVTGALGFLAAIPSPSFNSIGPLNLYGLMIAAGVVAATWLFGKRLEERGAGTADEASGMAIWAVLGGVIGARLYHVATDWERFEDDYAAIPQLWKGGLGIPGGLLLGSAVGLWMAHRRNIALSTALTCAAPAIPLAQAIGRWGNYFNQELYGRATDLPWALRIDEEHLVTDPATGQEFAAGTTFHPTFLYESLWNLGIVAVVLLVERRWRPGGGSLFGLYIALYGVGRFWVEGLRVDPADEIGPFRLNQWVALAAIVGGAVMFLALCSRPEVDPILDPDDESAGGEVDPDAESGVEPDDDESETSVGPMGAFHSDDVSSDAERNPSSDPGDPSN